MTKLSKWLKGNLKDNVKETLEATIEHLLKLNPPVKKNKRNALMSSLRALMKNDEPVRKEYESLNAWLNVNNSEKGKNLKIVDKEHQAMFKNLCCSVQYLLWRKFHTNAKFKQYRK